MKKITFLFSSFLLGLALAGLTYVPRALAASETVWDTHSQTLTCELEATHHHSYTNTTGPDSRYWYYSRVTKFRIYLHSDFMSAVDMDSLECSSGGSWISCDGGTSTADGGTRVTLHTGDTSSSAVYPNYIEWEYGRTTSTDSPWMAGYNDYDGDGDIDTEDEDYRSMGEYLTYDFNDDVSSGSSATTTSSVWIKFWKYNVSTGAWTAVTEGGSSDYHWNNDTDRDITYYECESVTCQSLDISPETGDLDINDVFSNVNFAVTATGSDGSDITGDSTFTYSVNKYGSANDAADADGTLRYSNRLGITTSSKSPTTTDSTVTFRSTEPGDTLYVYVSNYDGNSYEDTCYAEVQLPYCTDLEITDPTGARGLPYLGSVSNPYSTNIDIETETSSHESWPFNVTYESTDSTATFDGNSSPYTTTDNSITTYSSTQSATVTVGLDDQNGDGESDDVANACNDSFYYTMPITLPACASLEITTPTAPITAEAMEDGNVEISWVSYLTDGNPNPSTYVCSSTNPAGQFRDLTGRTSTAVISTTSTTVYYTGEPGDAITCMSTTPYSGSACIDTITSETTTPGAVCEDLSLGDPYVVEDDGSHTSIDLGNESSLETLYANDTVCFPFELNVESGFSGTLQAIGYTDSTRGTLASGLIDLEVDSSGSYVGNPATVGIGGATSYTGTVCWENFDENYVLDLEVVGSESVCSDSATLPPLTPVIGDDDDDDNGGHGHGHHDHDYTCDEVVDVNDVDDSEICEEYSMEVCVEDEDVEVVSSGDEICYYDQDDRDHSDPLACDTGELTLEAESTQNCYDVVIEGNVCSGTISVEYNGEVCYDDTPEQADVGVLNKFIYTFNFITNKENKTDDNVFFTHDEDRTFYTLDYTPAGSEDTLVFTDDMWDSSGIDGVFGSTGNSSGGTIQLADSLDKLTDYEYNYTLIKAFGFGEEYEEGSDSLADYVNSDAFRNDYQTFVPYLKYDDAESDRIDACTGAYENDDGETLYSDSSTCFDPLYTPEDDGRVVILNADAIPSDATLRIRYVGVIQSGITDECDDSDDECLTELFENTAKVFADPDDVEDPENTDACDEDNACDEDSAELVVLCSYLMTQNAGDIFIEGDLDSGSDISCAYINDEQNYSSYSNTDGLVILDAGDGSTSDDDDDDDDDDDSTSSSSTYYDSDISSVSVCDSDSNPDNLIGNISSYVCEIVSAVSDLWRSGTVNSTTDSHVSQAVRNADTAQGSNNERYTSWSDLEADLYNRNNPDSGILYFQGSGTGSRLTLAGTMEVPCGAWTVIVQDADLHLATNITYASSCEPSSGKNYTTDLPSIAFVVMKSDDSTGGGNIYVEDSAYRLVGVYYTNQSIDGDERSAVDGSLIIDGSIYGNIDPLLDAANYVGPPTLDGGSVVVRYDSRILLNTPPALSEYVDVSTQKGVN